MSQEDLVFSKGRGSSAIEVLESQIVAQEEPQGNESARHLRDLAAQGNHLPGTLVGNANHNARALNPFRKPLEGNGYNSYVITRDAWSLRQQQWAEYRRWARAQAPAEDSPEHSIADVGTILEWIPEAIRNEDRDPEKHGVQRMHFLLGLLNTGLRKPTAAQSGPAQSGPAQSGPAQSGPAQSA
jgi:hypothetical protein